MAGNKRAKEGAGSPVGVDIQNFKSPLETTHIGNNGQKAFTDVRNSENDAAEQTSVHFTT